MRAVLDGAVLGAVNLAEIVSNYARLGAARTDIEAIGLSLGDRYWLALARREDVPALTAERGWPDIAAAAGVTVELIR